MSFELSDFTPAKLNGTNVRTEKHGPEQLVPAIDLSFTVDRSNDVLSEFHPGLLGALYFRSEAGSTQGDLAGMEVSHQPNLRFTQLATPLKWDDELSGYTLTVDYGTGGKSNLVLTDCKVNEWRLTPKEGGTVEVKFRVQCSTNLTEKLLGKLSLLVQHEVSISLTPPEVIADQQQIPNPMPVDADEKKPLTAEDVFINGGAQALAGDDLSKQAL